MAASGKELVNLSQLKSFRSSLPISAYPVGAFYLSYTSTSPASIFGGSWTSISNGKYLRAAGSNTYAGSDYISVDNLPPHHHELSYNDDPANRAGKVSNREGDYTSVDGDYLYTGSTQSTNWRIYPVTCNTGRGVAFYPKYQNIYCWRRIA